MADVVVVGAGLAGTECAWQLAERGVRVRLIEQKPSSRTPAQHSDHMAELVCSNSFRGAALHNVANALFAAAMAIAMGSSLDDVRSGLRTFLPLSGRGNF